MPYQQCFPACCVLHTPGCLRHRPYLAPSPGNIGNNMSKQTTKQLICLNKKAVQKSKLQSNQEQIKTSFLIHMYLKNKKDFSILLNT